MEIIMTICAAVLLLGLLGVAIALAECWKRWKQCNEGFWELFYENDRLEERMKALEESKEVDLLREEVTALRKEAEALRKQVNDAILPDDSAARKAKEQIDAFNAGVYNILSYHGRQREPEVTDDDEE